MSHDKRGQMTRKRPTQVELERENSELKKRVQQLEKRLKQAARQLRNLDDVELEMQLAMDAEDEAAFQKDQVKTSEENDKNFLVFILPNGVEKRIPKKSAANE